MSVLTKPPEDLRSGSTARYPILNPGDDSAFAIRSELGEVLDYLVVKPGRSIASCEELFNSCAQSEMQQK